MKRAKKKNNRFLKIALLIVCIMLAAMIGFAILMESRGGMAPAETVVPETTEATLPGVEETEVPETTVPEVTEPAQISTQPENPDMMVSTPYCSLFYPGALKERVRAEGAASGMGYVVDFYGSVKEQEILLFTILFAEEQEESFPVGTISYEGITMDVSLRLPDITPDESWEPEDMEQAMQLQEGANYLLDKLEENPVFGKLSQSDEKEPAQSAEQPEQPTQKPAEPDNKDLKVETPYTDLYFPGQWKDSVRWEGKETQIGYIADFYGIVNGREARIFSIYFAESVDEAIPVGMLTADDMTMDVSIALWELAADSGWAQTEQDMFHALQEKINYMLDKLKEEPGFSPLDV